jgi:hypothetical protein
LSSAAENRRIQKLWFLYKTEGEPKGMSINDFCIHQGVPYNEFNKWFRKTHRSVVPVQIDGCPVTEVENQPAEVNQSPQTTVQNIKRKSNGILVSIQTRDGLHVRRGNLDYVGLVELIKKLEGLC